MSTYGKAAVVLGLDVGALLQQQRDALVLVQCARHMQRVIAVLVARLEQLAGALLQQVAEHLWLLLLQQHLQRCGEVLQTDLTVLLHE